MIAFIIGYLVLVVLVQFVEALPEFIVKAIMFPLLPFIGLVQLWREGRKTLAIIFGAIILLLLSFIILILCLVK